MATTDHEVLRSSAKPKGTYQDYINKDTTDKLFVFELLHKNAPNGTVRSKDTGRTQTFPLSETFPMVGQIFYTSSNGVTSPRNIRYVPGENSIFNDEQTPDDKYPKKKVRANFIDGRVYVDGMDAPKLKFFMEWDINDTKQGRDVNKIARFRLVDTGKIIAKARLADKIKFDVVNWCYTADFKTKIHPLASLFFSQEQMQQNVEDVRWNLKLKAERDPAAFQLILDNPHTERKIMVKRAISEGYLYLNINLNSLCWSDSPGQPISTAVMGKDPITDFVEKSYAGDNQRYYEAIYGMVNPSPAVESEIVAHSPEKSSFKAPLITAPSESDTELKMMLTLAKEKGLVTFAKPFWFKYKGQSFKKEEGFISELKENATMLSVLKAELAQ